MDFKFSIKNRKPILFYKIIIHPRHASNEGQLYTVGPYAKRIVWRHVWIGIITENEDKRPALAIILNQNPIEALRNN